MTTTASAHVVDALETYLSNLNAQGKDITASIRGTEKNLQRLRAELATNVEQRREVEDHLHSLGQMVVRRPDEIEDLTETPEDRPYDPMGW